MYKEKRMVFHSFITSISSKIHTVEEIPGIIRLVEALISLSKILEGENMTSFLNLLESVATALNLNTVADITALVEKLITLAEATKQHAALPQPAGVVVPTTQVATTTTTK
jgi:hypothetical protein